MVQTERVREPHFYFVLLPHSGRENKKESRIGIDKCNVRKKRQREKSDVQIESRSSRSRILWVYHTRIRTRDAAFGG